MSPEAPREDYAVYAIRFAHRDASWREEHFYRSHREPHEAMPISYYVWLIAGRGRTILVDTGFTREVAQRRGDRHYLQDPVDSLAALGVAAESVDTVVLTHLHYDHTGLLDRFPRARLLLQEREFAYWTGPHATRGENPHLVEPDDLARIVGLHAAGRLELLAGDTEIAPGVLVHLAGGHTAGLQVVAVDRGGASTVITSDASHFLANVEGDRPYSIVDHLPSMYDAFDWITARVGATGTLVPGHDPAVMERFAPVPGLEGIAVRIA